MSKKSCLTDRLVRCLRDWNPKDDGPLIEVGTLVEAFPRISPAVWHGALAGTRACGYGATKRDGIEGRKYQHWRLGVLARGLVPWLARHHPDADLALLRALVDELVAATEAKRDAARVQSAAGVSKTAALKREKRAAVPKPARKSSKPLKITSDELFKVW